VLLIVSFTVLPGGRGCHSIAPARICNGSRLQPPVPVPADRQQVYIRRPTRPKRAPSLLELASQPRWQQRAGKHGVHARERTIHQVREQLRRVGHDFRSAARRECRRVVCEADPQGNGAAEKGESFPVRPVTSATRADR
jgi:hypothetical protein